MKTNHVPFDGARFKGFLLECSDFFWCRDFPTQIYLTYCHSSATLNHRIMKHNEEYA